MTTFLRVTGLVAVVFGGILLILGSAATKPPEPPPTVSSEYAVPEFRYQPDAQPVQKKGNVTMSLVPVEYTLVERARVTEENKPQPFLWVEPDPNRVTVRWFDKIETPYFELSPENLRFAVKITNQSDKILRMAGSIATYSVDNKVLNVPQENYAEFAATIIPRGQTVETTINGPSVSALRDAGGTVFVSIDEVVTDVDAAGRPTKTSNFEWFLSYSMNRVQKSGTVRRTSMTESRSR